MANGVKKTKEKRREEERVETVVSFCSRISLFYVGVSIGRNKEHFHSPSSPTIDRQEEIPALSLGEEHSEMHSTLILLLLCVAMLPNPTTVHNKCHRKMLPSATPPSLR